MSHHQLGLLSLCNFSPPCWHGDPEVPGRHIWCSLDEIVGDWRANREKYIADCKAAWGAMAEPRAVEILDRILNDKKQE